jgi:hypothetical protein
MFFYKKGDIQFQKVNKASWDDDTKFVVSKDDGVKNKYLSTSLEELLD